MLTKEMENSLAQLLTATEGTYADILQLSLEYLSLQDSLNFRLVNQQCNLAFLSSLTLEVYTNEAGKICTRTRFTEEVQRIFGQKLWELLQLADDEFKETSFSFFALLGNRGTLSSTAITMRPNQLRMLEAYLLFYPDAFDDSHFLGLCLGERLTYDEERGEVSSYNSLGSLTLIYEYFPHLTQVTEAGYQKFCQREQADINLMAELTLAEVRYGEQFYEILPLLLAQHNPYSEVKSFLVLQKPVTRTPKYIQLRGLVDSRPRKV